LFPLSSPSALAVRIIYIAVGIIYRNAGGIYRNTGAAASALSGK